MIFSDIFYFPPLLSILVQDPSLASVTSYTIPGNVSIKKVIFDDKQNVWVTGSSTISKLPNTY